MACIVHSYPLSNDVVTMQVMDDESSSPPMNIMRRQADLDEQSDDQHGDKGEVEKFEREPDNKYEREPDNKYEREPEEDYAIPSKGSWSNYRYVEND
ncbi:hypothetical protein BC940DRAFT_312625 [Gongronella butleri]|nr:hypothetical protein BC940DRAFT_312625 [Gongronella butleri]